VTHPHVVPNPKTLVHLWNTNQDLFDKIGELSIPPLTAAQLPL